VEQQNKTIHCNTMNNNTTGFNKLKQNRAASINKLVEAAEKINTAKTYGDDRLWSPVVDKAGNGYAIIRFLPAKEGEDLPWVRFWDHGFKGPTGRWYIENSLTSIGQPDPVAEINSILWNSGNEKDKEIARERKRRLHYVSNILVVSDPANPDNEGKVFLYKFGKKIFDKIMDIMQPQFQDETPINPFDFWTGANFKLKIRNFEGYRNYDKSEFDGVSELFGGDEAKLEKVYNTLYSLKDFVDPASYKSYADLKRKLVEVLGSEALAGSMTEENSVTARAELIGKTVEASPTYTEVESPEINSKDDDDDESLSYFAKLAQG
jgi:hypothetical protein